MHLVRGVSAFLRKSSHSHSNSERHSEPGESLVQPASWPEIEFRVDFEDVLNMVLLAHAAALLFGVLQCGEFVLDDKFLEDSQKALELFLVSFDRVFESWIPEEVPEDVEVLARGGETESDSAIDRRGVSMGGGTIEGCKRGHPTKVIVGLIQELKGTTRSLNNLHANPDGSMESWLSPSEMEAALRLLHAITIITRSFHNRRIYSYFGGLQTLMGVMKSAVFQLKGAASVVLSSGVTSLAASMQLSFLQCLLTHIVSSVANYIDAEARVAHKFGMPVTSLEPILLQRTVRDVVSSTPERSPAPSRTGSRRSASQRRSSNSTDSSGSQRISGSSESPGERSGCETLGITNGSVPLLETGGLNWFVELLRILRKLRLKGMSIDASLEVLTLRTLKSTIVANPRTQNHFRSIGGLEVLLDGLGTPATPSDRCRNGQEEASPAVEEHTDNDDARDVGVSSFSKLLEDFEMQILSLQVLREAVFRNVTSLQSLRDHGGVQKYIEVIRWAAFTFPDMDKRLNSSADASRNTMEGNAGLPGALLEHQGSKESRQRRKIKATPSGFLSTMLNVNEYSIEDSLKTSVGQVQTRDDQDSPVQGDNLQGWNWRVADLCRILCSFLVPAGDVLNLARGLQGGQEGVGTSVIYWELATKCIVNVLLGVFRGADDMGHENKALQASRLLSSTLQHYTLYVLKKFLEVSPTALQLFREDRVWDVMFSEYFFYLGLGDCKNMIPSRNEEAMVGGSSPGQENSAQKYEDDPRVICAQGCRDVSYSHIPESVDTEPLRLEVISFVELAATVNGTSDNLPECSALLEALQQCCLLTSIPTMLAKSLHRVLQLASDATIRSFQLLDATTVLSQVMEHQRQAAVKLGKESLSWSFVQSDSEDKSLTEVDLWLHACGAVFALFAEYFAVSEEAVYEAARNSKAVDALLGLLWESKTQAFALRHILLLMKLPPVVEQDKEAKLELCLKYLESLPRAQVECRGTDISLVLDLLAGLRDVLQIDQNYYQGLFRDGECFVHIVSLLNEDHSREAGVQLSLEVINTLTHLLQGNEASKASFCCLVCPGYKTLQSLLLERHQGKPSRGLLTALLDMLVDGGFQIPTNMLIQNEDVVLLFFNLLQKCEAGDQVFGLDIFHTLLEESTANRSSCVRAGLLIVLLDWFAMEQSESLVVKVAQLMQMIGGHSISGKDMRRIFALLRGTKDGSRPRHGTLLLQILRGMLKESGPAVFFELSGRDSGIFVTTPLRWPTNRGYSFCCWARVESFPPLSSQRAEDGMMGLFSFLSEAGKGCTALLCDDQLTVESISSKRQTISMTVGLQVKRWYFICITHSTGRALAGGNSLKVFLDGELKTSEKLRYPKVNEFLTKCTVGAKAPLPSVNGSDIDTFSGKYSTPFCGQLGPMYLFDDVMSSEQVMAVYSLGPGYMYSFLSSEVGCVPVNVSTQSVIDSKDGLASKMIFGFNAQASAGRALFDVSSVLEQSSDGVIHGATIMAGTLLCYRHLVQDIVHCVGGIDVFFPLLTQLDQPVSDSLVILDSRGKQYWQSPLEGHVAVEVLELVTGVLDGNLSNQQYMHNICGMSVLGCLLQSVSPQHLTVKVVSSLERLLETVRRANGALLSEQLVKEALQKLFLNPHIWLFTPFIVQRELYTSLLNYGETDGNQLHHVCGLPKVLDTLRQFYWDKPKSRRALGTKPLLHPGTKTVIGERPSQSEVAKLRLLVLGLAEIALRHQVTLLDVKALVAFTEGSEDIVSLEDVLHMVLGLLGRKSLALAFADHVNTLGGCQIFMSLLKRPQESTRLLGIRLVGALLITNTIEKKGFGGTIISTLKAVSDFQSRLDKQKSSFIFALMTDRIMAFPFTDVVRATLFDIMLGGASPKQVLQGGPSKPELLKHPSKNKRDMAESISHIGERSTLSTFVLPQLLGVILKLMVGCDDMLLRMEILKDILRLLKANPANSEALTMEPYWQGWLFSALVSSTKRTKQLAGDSAEETLWLLGAEEVLIRSILCTFHVHCVCTLRGGWRHAERTINYIHMYADEGRLSKFHTLHAILGDLFEAMVQGLPLQASLFAHPCRDNVLYLLALVDELVMGDAFRLLPFPFTGDSITDDTTDNSLLSGEYIDVGFSTTVKPASRRKSPEEVSLLSGAQGARRKLTVNRSRGWQRRTSQGEVIDLSSKDQYWRLYDKVWSLLIAMNGRGMSSKGNFHLTSPAGPISLGQRARGLVESINIPASEMAAVVSGGLGAVGIGSGGKLIDKSFRMRGEKCPRVVFRLVLLYLFEGDLESASRCVQQFLALLPGFLSTENEQNKNRLQLLLWTLVDARAQIGAMDNGARYLVVSQLIRETMEGGKNMLATSLADKDKTCEENSTSEFPLHNLLQQDRVMSAVKEDARYLKATTAQRSNEVEALRVEVNEFFTQEVQQRKSLEDQSHSVLTVICSGDRSRRSSAQLAYDEEQQAISEHWCHMFRDLTDERGPWSAVSFPNDIVTRWKLDKTEDPSRRRLKLKRNYHFNEELMRPVTRSPASKPDEPVNEPGSTVDLLLGGVRTFLLKGLRGVSEETYSDDEEVSDEELDTDFSEGESVENGLKEADQGGDVTEATDEATPSPQQLHMAAVGDGGEEEVLLSVVCILVAPKRKVAGRLEVMRSSLHFYGEFVVEGTGGQSVFTRSGGLNYPDGISTETPEKGSLKPKINFREKSSTEGGDFEKGNAMERLDPMQQCATHGGPSKDVKRHRRWDLSQVKAVHATRYLLQNSALEIFFTNSRPPVFINFPSQRVSKDVGTTIIYLRNGPSSGKSSLKDKEDMILYVDKRKAYDLAEKARDKWHRREMNNFDYLMTLNTLSGRSYNDLTQYPVFPWILADYSSEKLDFSNPATFRDLSKPIGALDMKRFKVFEERYQNFSDPDIPSFYYGSHYSSMGIVLFYLLRLEPFTSFHRQLQGGKFDHADRLFHSIEGAFRNCLTHTSDVKELIPEFFYLPEFLINSNEYYLGVKQDGEQLGAVVLPPWAKGSAEEFVRKNREALESEYVSEHLHEWVDLIFGCKQRGRPAVEAANVFYHLTYEGAVDLEAMDSALERSAVEDQIANFGQTPMQLFKKKHHKRGPPIPIARPLYYAPASIALTSYINSSLASPIMYVGLIGSKVVTINGNLGMTVRPWMTPSIQSSGGSFTFSSSQDLFFSVGPDISVSRKLGGPFGEDVAVTPSCFGTLQVRSSFFLLTCGHWDNSFKVISLNDGRMVQSNCQHKDVVTCLSVAVDGSVVVTGSRDTTVMVWDIELTSGSGHRRIGSSREPSTEKPSKSDSVVITDKPRHVLCGHDDAVTCIAVRVELDIVISGSKDATCIFHSLRDGSYIRSLKHPNGSPITRMSVSQNGLLVVYSNADLSLNVYSINGKLLASTDCKGQVNGMDISWCGDFLICGGDQGLVVVRNIHTLETVRKYDGTQVPISSLTATPEDCFLVGTQDGSLLVFSLEIQHQKKGNFFASRARALVPGNLIPGS